LNNTTNLIDHWMTPNSAMVDKKRSVTRDATNATDNAMRATETADKRNTIFAHRHAARLHRMAKSLNSNAAVEQTKNGLVGNVANYHVIKSREHEERAMEHDNVADDMESAE
jgi:hypothetical protein